LALTARASCDPATGVHLAGHVLASGIIAPGSTVAGFWPLPGEIDLRPLLLALAGRGCKLLLPETTLQGHKLVFRRWRWGKPLVPGRFGTWHPLGEAAAPDVVLAPMLAWDGQGRRLGYGGGYYDRTLGGLPGALRLGCAFAGQFVAVVPAGPGDQRLDAVATELGVTRFGQ